MTRIQLQLTYRDFVEIHTELSVDKAREDVAMRIEGNAAFVRPCTSAAQAGDRKSFGALVQRLRREASLTQAELAERVKRSTSWVGQVERGARQVDRVSVLRDLARALGLDDEAVLLPDVGDAGEGARWEIIPARSVYRAWVTEE